MNPVQLNTVKPDADSLGEKNPDRSDGVDLTLIQWMLSLNPTERLQTLQQYLMAFGGDWHDSSTN